MSVMKNVLIERNEEDLKEWNEEAKPMPFIEIQKADEYLISCSCPCSYGICDECKALGN